MVSPKVVIKLMEAWLLCEPSDEYREEIRELIWGVKSGRKGAATEADNLFGSRLSFGTAGIRGPIRPGPSGINLVTVAQVSMGLARYVISSEQEPLVRRRIVIGFDARRCSKEFASVAASVMSAQGIEVLAFDDPIPTPLLAYSVRELATDAGVMITASHNPASDNGYKVFLGRQDEGSQVTSPADKEIEAQFHNIPDDILASGIPRSTCQILPIPVTLFGNYVSNTLNSLALPSPPGSSLTIVYTPMHGVGGATFIAAMTQASFLEPHVVEEQYDPDPDFPTVAFPNPEEEGAFDLSFEKARSVGADLIIAHDPDADRLAVALPDPLTSAEFRALTGNQVGAIFAWHLGKKAHAAGSKGTLANSLVSSPVLGKIAQHFGLDYEETLTGFKHISRVKNLIFGFEEALGYLVTPDVVRDKDGISAGLLMVSLAQTLAAHGKTLWDYLEEIQKAVGSFASGQITIRLDAGVPGSAFTSALREKRILRIGSRSVQRFDDFLEGVGPFPKADMLRYYLDNGTRVIARPSGTESKVKVYIDTEGATSAESQARLTEVEFDINELVSSL